MITTPADTVIESIRLLFVRPYAKGLVLLAMVIIAMVWANSSFYESYDHFFHTSFTIGFEGFAITEPVHIWINDGLMAVFFFSIGLEIKREFIQGELSSFKKAALPIFAALGGMVVPALLFYSINYGTEAQKAWGIPMATDIAFTLGLISLLGSLVSDKLKMFLTALATADDLGAILVIAFFLTPFIDLESLVAAAIYLGIMITANYLGVRNFWFYLTVGVLGLWIALLLSGIHATLAGVLGALTIPARRKITEKEFQKDLNQWLVEFNSSCDSPDALLTHQQEDIIEKITINGKRAGTPIQRIERKLAPVINFMILPLFALANAGVHIEGDLIKMLIHPVSLGIMVGLVVGKVMGIFLFSYVWVKTGLGQIPKNSDWNQILGLGLFAGIGFTMSLFIAELALTDKSILAKAKVAIIAASVLSSLLGFIWFRFMVKRTYYSIK